MTQEKGSTAYIINRLNVACCSVHNSSILRRREWQTWNVFDDVSETFTNLSQHPTLIGDVDFLKKKKIVKFFKIWIFKWPIRQIWLESPGEQMYQIWCLYHHLHDSSQKLLLSAPLIVLVEVRPQIKTY